MLGIHAVISLSLVVKSRASFLSDLISQRLKSWRLFLRSSLLSRSMYSLLEIIGASNRGPVSDKEWEIFNREYGQRLMADYGIAPAKTCVLDVVSRKTEERSRIPQARSHHSGMLLPDREIAVAQGVLNGNEGHAPVSIAYRFERTAADMPWQLKNVSLNGQPLDAFSNP